ncbi:MAG: response regulator [Chloroflexi bacterium]|nr:response regulator [Chloroflexota bacterium]
MGEMNPETVPNQNHIPAHTDIPPGVLRGWTILVVEGDTETLTAAQQALERHGAQVIVAQCAEMGLALASATRPRLIITGLVFEDDQPAPCNGQRLDGWGLLGQLKADQATRAIPVLALTAYAKLGDDQRVLDAGFHHYLNKPLIPDHFIGELIERLSMIPLLAGYLPL